MPEVLDCVWSWRLCSNEIIVWIIPELYKAEIFYQYIKYFGSIFCAHIDDWNSENTSRWVLSSKKIKYETQLN